MRPGAAVCGLVVTEVISGLEPILANALGIGCGCSMPDSDTTEAQINEFDRKSYIKIFGHKKST